MDTDQFDYVIVGGGTAGCLLANRLSADPSKRVCLLEAGGEDNWIWINIPVGYLYCIANPRTDWMFRTTRDPGLNGRDIHYARGRGLGGCSLINAMIYMRGQKRDYDHWATVTGDPGWEWESVLPHFLKHEDSHRGDSRFHRSGGEIRVEEQRLSWKILDRFAQATRQTFIAALDDMVVVHAIEVLDMQRGARLLCEGLEPLTKELGIPFAQFGFGEIHVPHEVWATGEIQRNAGQRFVHG